MLIGELSPEQMRSELEKYRIMNEARAKKGLAPIPVPADLQSGNVRYVTVGSSTGERSPMVVTTEAEMPTTVRTLQQVLAERSAQARATPPPTPAAPPDVPEPVLGVPVQRRPRKIPSTAAMESVRAMVVEGTPAKKKSLFPWILGAAALGGGYYVYKRRRR